MTIQNDSVSEILAGTAIYQPDIGSITLKVSNDEDKETSENEEKDKSLIIVHEKKHDDNNKAGIFSEEMSVEQYYKISMHDEISANIATVIALREEYIKTKDINVFYNSENMEELSFYAEAIERGEIFVNSEDPKEFEKEMSFIMNGTKNMWEKELSFLYVQSGLSKGIMFSKNDTPNDKAYQKALEICYNKNLGGIEFLKYMEKDIEIPANLKETMDTTKDIMKNKFNGKMSLEQWDESNKHKERSSFLEK